MEINVDGHGYHSDPFNYNTPDSLLLKFKDQVRLKLSEIAYIRNHS